MDASTLNGLGRKIIYCLITILLCFSLGIEASGAQAQSTIPIGTTFLLSGKWAVYGLDNQKGMEIALEEINADKVLGKTLEIIWEDTAGDKTVAMALLRKFAGKPEVPLVIQVSTSELVAQAQLAKELGIPIISTGSVGSKVPLNEWTYRVNLPVVEAVPILLKGVKDKKGVRKVAVIYDMANEYPSSEAKLVSELIKNDPEMELVAFESFKTGDRDFSAQLSKIRRKTLDALWVAGTADEVGLILYQAKQMGIKSLFVGGTAFIDPATYDLSKGAMAGAVVSLQFSPSDPRPVVQNFVRKYKTKYKKSPPLYAALGYDTMLIITDSIRRAGKVERNAIRDALSSVNGLEGLCGKYTYNGHPDNQTPEFRLYVITGKGQYEPL